MHASKWLALLSLGVFLQLCLIAIAVYLFFIRSSSDIENWEYFGVVPLCNLDAERAPHFGRFVFPLCYRCTFIILGTFIAFFLFYGSKIKISWYLICFSVVMILPCFVDGFVQLLTSYTSNNLLRAFSGFCAGSGIGYIISIPFKYWNLFIHFRHSRR